MKVLLIEDDGDTRRFIERGLTERGCAVDCASTGQDGLFRATHGDHDVLIVDRMLPGLDGVSLVVALRGMKVLTPVLFLTALDGISDRVRGLEAGGDDYLVKPFALAELHARLNALARRPPLSEHAAVFRIGDLEIDYARRQASHAGRRIVLQSREFQILEYLARNAGRIVTRSMMLRTIWDIHFDPSTNIVETHISRLRSKLAREGVPAIIHTMRGAGYILQERPAEAS